MREVEFRSVIKMGLDSVAEADLIDKLNDLASHRKLGGFMEDLIRFEHMNREAMNNIGFHSGYCGVQQAYHNERTEANKELGEIKETVNKIYELLLEMKASFDVGEYVELNEVMDTSFKARALAKAKLALFRKDLGLPPNMEYVDGIYGDNEKLFEERVSKVVRSVLSREEAALRESVALVKEISQPVQVAQPVSQTVPQAQPMTQQVQPIAQQIHVQTVTPIQPVTEAVETSKPSSEDGMDLDSMAKLLGVAGIM